MSTPLLVDNFVDKSRFGCWWHFKKVLILGLQKIIVPANHVIARSRAIY